MQHYPNKQFHIQFETIFEHKSTEHSFIPNRTSALLFPSLLNLLFTSLAKELFLQSKVGPTR